MKPIHVWFAILALIVGCGTALAPTPSPMLAPTATPIPFAADLIPSLQSDIDLPQRPTRYDITLTYDPAFSTLTGSQEVLFTNRTGVNLSEIYFRLFANYPNSGGKITVTRALVNGSPASPTYETENTCLRVPLSTPLEPGSSVTIHLEYAVSIPRNNRGHYDDFIAADSVTTMPSVYPLIPAYDSKGWHTELPPPYGDLVYADASLYAVTMTVPATMTVIASGSVVGTTDNTDGTKTIQSVGAPMRDFDLNVTAQLQKASTTVGEVTVNSYFEPGDSVGGNDALKWASDALQVYIKRFGSYPYRKLDVVETPTIAGGIEYPTVVAIARALYKDNRNREFFEFAVAHEVAHQWWYGVVGDDQVNTPWVDESLAQYSALIYMEDVHGQVAAQTVLRGTFQGMYNQAKNAGHDTAVNQPVSAFDEQNYSAIVYGKGPLFYDALRKQMGDDVFFKFLRSVYEQYRYKILMPQDILRVAESVYGGNLHDLYQQWILSPAPK